MFLFGYSKFISRQQNLETTITKIVRYRVKKKKLAKVKRALAEFVETVRKNEPGTIVYEAFEEKNDLASFVHIMSFKDKKAERDHVKSEHVKKWMKILYPNCKQEPEFMNLRSVKSLRGPESKTPATESTVHESRQ